MVLRTCQQVEGGLPSNITLKMYFNIILDFGIGLLPILGDLADAAFRANTRNAVVLEKYLREKGAAALKARGRSPPTIDPSDPDEYDRQIIEQHDPPPQYTTSPPNRQGGQVQLSQPPKAKAPAEKRGGGRWFSFGAKTRQADIESGNMRQMSGSPPAPMSNLPAPPRPTVQKNRPGY